MRFGICMDIAKAEGLDRLGFDYFEGKLNAIAKLDEDDFNSVLSTLGGCRTKVEACSLLFPKDMVLIGDGAVSDDALCAYLHLAFSRMERLGADVAVFGSGKSRFVPQGMSYRTAFSILVDRTRIIGRIAEEHGITVAIEPLNRNETNLINSITEGAILQECVGMDSVSLLADMFHMCGECEDMKRIGLVSPLAHVHVALASSRAFPTHRTEELVEFFKNLKAAGYCGRMSIEGKSGDVVSDSLESLKVLSELDKEEL